MNVCKLLSRISIENSIKINIKNVNVYECNHSSEPTLLKINVTFNKFVEKKYLHRAWLSVLFPFFGGRGNSSHGSSV